MGLDGVELIISTEECFGISIADGEASAVVTVGDLERLVIAKLDEIAGTEHQGDAVCLSMHTFHRLRRALREILGTERARLRPDTPLAELLPIERRRALWQSLQNELELRLPGLVRPDWLLQNGLGCLLLIPLVLAVLAGMQVISKQQGWLLFALSIACAFVIERYSRPLARHFARGCSTLGDLCETVLAANLQQVRNSAGSARARQGVWNITEVRTVLYSLICEQLGVSREQLGPDVRFVQDLGMD